MSESLGNNETRETRMADLPPYADAGDDPGTPRWVKILGIIALVVVLLVVVVILAGGGLGGHTPPEGGH